MCTALKHNVSTISWKRLGWGADSEVLSWAPEIIIGKEEWKVSLDFTAPLGKEGGIGGHVVYALTRSGVLE